MSGNDRIVIIGGGLAGLTAAIHLAQAGADVVVYEKETYPRHKVCGEYISNEVLPYWLELGIDPFAWGATRIKRCALSSISGRLVQAPLPLGGFGISRYHLDDQLQQLARQKGVKFVQAEISALQYQDGRFRIKTRNGEETEAALVIGAYGKRSRLDKEQHRSFIQQRTPYLAVKRHFAGDFPDDLVALHNFAGGYCGVSKVEDGRINVCYLTDYHAFKSCRNIEQFESAVVSQNPHLAACFRDFTPLFDAPLTISQISFADKERVHQHVLMCGDSAGMIHPLCGNGMGMAISSAQLLSQLLIQYLNGDLADRAALEQRYAQEWQRQFRRRLQAGRLFSRLFARNQLFDRSVSLLTHIPAALPFFIRQTHG
ncbi:MAG: NAD(P)/FAD-dependent oxidoreductase [Bacteroidota bacterium]